MLVHALKILVFLDTIGYGAMQHPVQMSVQSVEAGLDLTHTGLELILIMDL